MDARKIFIAIFTGVLSAGLWQCYGRFLLAAIHAG